MPRREKFNPVPARLIRMRYGVPYRGDFRFYGLYQTLDGRRKRASFQVMVSPSMLRRRKGLGGLIRATINAIKYQKKMPIHRQGDVFSSFSELLFRTPWVRIRKLLRYKAGVEYER